MKIIFLAIVILLNINISGQSQNKYIGAAKCKICHISKGKQYQMWAGTAHAKAFETLKTGAALKIAGQRKISNPSSDARCLKCHSTGAAVDASLKAGITNEEGVSCESCHGPGSNYKAPVIMRNRCEAMKKGLIIPDEKLCRKCHNAEAPVQNVFDYKTANAKIIHPNP